MAIVNITVEIDADFYRLFQYVMATGGAPINMTGASIGNDVAAARGG